MTDTFFADVSSWQRVVDNSYPHPVLSFRVDHGGAIDSNAHANWQHIASSPSIKVGIAYVVFKPGQGHAILERVKAFFGDKPPAKLAVMIDMESGSDFAGPGNHSAEASQLAENLAAYLGSDKRVLGYANGYDWAKNWPTRPSWLKRVVASYGSQDPGAFQWQYYGGASNYASPSGYPRSCPPFGSNVDMNVIHHSISEIEQLLGLNGTDPTDDNWSDNVNQDDLKKLIAEEIVKALRSYHLGEPRAYPYTHNLHPYIFPSTKDGGVDDRLKKGHL